MKARKKILPYTLVIILLGCVAPDRVEAGDKSFSSVVKHLKANYGAKQQGFFGAMMLARFVVKIVRPAGVKNFKVAMLKDLDFSEGNSREGFQVSARRLVSKEWQPLIQYNTRRGNQFTHVYVQQDSKDVKLLVITLQRKEAFVVQTKFSPEKLIKFIDDPKILGISLKEKTGGNPQSQPDPKVDSDEDEATGSPKKTNESAEEPASS